MADKWRIDLNWIEDNSNYTSEKKFISWYGWGEKKKNDYIRDGEWCGAVILEICKTGLDKHTTDDLP